MTNRYIEDIDIQYNALLEAMNIPLKPSNKKYFLIFKEIYAIKLLIGRPELQKFIANDYTDAYFNFIIEAFICILRNEKNASSLLLRSAIENFLKLVLTSLDLKINDRSFSVNHKTLSNFLNEDSYTNISIEANASTLQRQYSNLSAISHSFTNLNNQSIAKSFTRSLTSTIDSTDGIIQSWCIVLKSTFTILIMLSSQSIKFWDTDDISNYLKLVMGEKAKNSMIANLKSH